MLAWIIPVLAVFYDAANAISCLIIILRIDLLNVLNIFDELLVLLLTRLDCKVLDVCLDGLRVRLHEAVNFDKSEEGADSDASEVEL